MIDILALVGALAIVVYVIWSTATICDLKADLERLDNRIEHRFGIVQKNVEDIISTIHRSIDRKDTTHD